MALTKSLIHNQYPVIYFDNLNSVRENKLIGIDTSLLAICRPWDLEPTELLSTLNTLAKELPSLVLIFDNPTFLSKVWTGWTFLDFIKSLRSQNSNLTIIATQRKEVHSDYWNSIVAVTHLRNIYFDDEEGEHIYLGQIIQLLGDDGKATAMVSQITGLISEAYDTALFQVQQGEKTKTSIFEKDNLAVRGAWNFIYRSELQREHELRIN